MPGALETVTLEGVEILSAGGPVHGQGSPPEGDFWTTDDLRAMADAASDLGSELDAPNKIGHSDAQALLLNSELAPVTPGEMPRIGTLTNQRVSDDGQKLLTDIAGVPKKAAELLKSAWPKRSVELGKVTSQKTGKVYDWVVTGLSWLGANLPAVQTLEDVVALYEGAGVELRRIVVYETGDVAWDPTSGFQALRDHVSEALNGPPTGGMNSPRFWVRDVDISNSRALVEDYYEDGGTEAWIIPFTQSQESGIAIAPSSDWVKAEQAWVEAARGLERELDSGSGRGRADTRAMKFTDEQRRKFAEATGLAVDKVTDEMLGNAGIEVEKDPVVSDEQAREIAKVAGVEGDQVTGEKLLEAVKRKFETDDDGDDGDGGGDDERYTELERRLQAAEKRSTDTAEELRVERRNAFVEEAIKDGRIKPGARKQLERLYDKDADGAREFVSELDPDEELAREYGSDEPTGDDLEAAERAYKADASARLGIPEEELV